MGCTPRARRRPAGCAGPRPAWTTAGGEVGLEQGRAPAFTVEHQGEDELAGVRCGGAGRAAHRHTDVPEWRHPSPGPRETFLPTEEPRNGVEEWRLDAVRVTLDDLTPRTRHE